MKPNELTCAATARKVQQMSRSVSAEHSIFIATSPVVVWTATIDVCAWPNWTPTVTGLHAQTEKPFGIGARYEIKQPLQPRQTWEVISFVPGAFFAWETRGNGRTMRAWHHLESTDTGTIGTTGIEASNVSPWAPSLPLRWLLRFALKAENVALKRYCEGL